MNLSTSRASAAVALLMLAPSFSFGCASCGCSLNADAAMGYSAEPGLRLSFEYDYIHQDQLRSGTHRIDTVADGDELERETLNRYFTFGIDYNPDANWNVDLRLPYVVRTHSTYGTYESGAPPPALSDSRSSSLGDMRLIGSYQGFLPGHNLGVQLGVKLPTGQYGTDVKFREGPQAGSPVDASLQPGTGSTDIIMGAYYYRPIGEDFDVFVNGQFQSAVTGMQDRPGKDFRPGNSVTVSFGVRYAVNPRWVPQLQMNWVHKNVDQGALADITDTAGYIAYLSPGLTAQVAGHLQAYAFAQLPVYTDLLGNQLFPRYTLSIGASYAF